jgi:translation initiation factor IF-1
MPKEDKIEVEGVVIQNHGSDYEVEIDLWSNKYRVIAYMSGKMKQHKITVIPGDKVQVELNEIDPTKWRITFRFKK